MQPSEKFSVCAYAYSTNKTGSQGTTFVGYGILDILCIGSKFTSDACRRYTQRLHQLLIARPVLQ